MIIKYKDIKSAKYKSEKFDKCIIANGLIGFHQLLPEIKINFIDKKDLKIKSKYNFMTHQNLMQASFTQKMGTME